VLNSLSLDFIPASLALMREGGWLVELGRDGSWSGAFCAAAAPLVAQRVFDLPTVLEQSPEWMQRVVAVIAARVEARVLRGLPLRVLELECGMVAAFSCLQHGTHIGKLVLRMPRAEDARGKGSHLVSGGGGGLGLATCRWLMSTGVDGLILASRSGVISTADVHSLSTSSAGHVSAARCDVAEPLEAARLIGGVPCVLSSRLSGVWHAAGVLADGLFRSQTAKSVHRVFAPKAIGAWGLHRLCASAPLDTFVVFSSIMALLGGGGQANYAAANCCLDSLSGCRRLDGASASSVQWGPWAQVGMAAGAIVNRRLQAAGMGLLEPRTARVALEIALKCLGPSMFCLVPFNWEKYSRAHAQFPPYMSAFAFSTPPVTDTMFEMAPERESASVAKQLSLEAILEILAVATGSTVDADVPLMQLGLDSLGAVELGNQLHLRSGQPVSRTLVFDFPTARLIYGYMISLLEPAVLRAHPSPSVSITGASVHADHLQGRAQACLHGMRCTLPGGVNKDTFLDHLTSSAGIVTSEVPLQRWSLDFTASLSDPIGQRVRHGGFLRHPELFDNAFFRVSPVEAGAMDPQ